MQPTANSGIKNPLLQQATDHVTQSVDDQASFQKLVSAGEKAIYDKNIFAQLTKTLPQSKDPVSDVAKGIVGVMTLLAQRARGTVPRPTLIQAGAVLMFEALDFIEQAGLVTIGKDELSKATMDYAEAVMPTVSMNQQRVGGILGQLKGIAGDPQKLAAFQQAVEAS